jgi:hypothetical protein
VGEVGKRHGAALARHLVARSHTGCDAEEAEV